MNIAALILAAGASRRMGAPKALLLIDGESFIDRLIGAFAPHCSKVVVVLGHHGHTIRNAARRASQVDFVWNPDPERGQLSSLQCGLRAAPPEAAAVMFTPVDYPRIRPATVATLAGALANAGPDVSVVVPTHSGKHGHPASVRRELIGEFLALPPTAIARDVIHRHIANTLYLEVDDPGILHDIDDPETYHRHLALNQSR
jgi:molybdenum cofactor cytidylyltransferase